MTSAPKFHLQRVFDDGETSAPQILPILDLPHDARLTRREFVGSGMTIASVLAALGGYTEEAGAQPASGSKAPPSPVPDAPKRASPGRPVHAHRGSVTALAVTPDSSILVSGAAEGTPKLWSLPNAKLLRTMMEPTGAGITHVATSAEGRWAITASFAYRVKLWALPDGRPDKELPYHGHIAAMAMGADGTLLVAGGKTIRFWSVPKVRLAKELAVSGNDIASLATSADGKLLVAGQQGSNATLWALPEGRVLATLGEQGSSFREIAFAPDGSFLASIMDGGNEVALWPMPQGSPMRRSVRIRRGIMKIAVTPDSKRIVFGGADGSVGILSVARLEGPYQALGDHEAGISALAITRDGKILVTGDSSGVIALWDLEKGDRIGYAFDPAASRNDGITYSVRDSVTGQLITYTLPCGSPIPAGATCVCNCVPGTYQPPAPAPSSTPYRGGGGRRICTCDKVCTCVPVRSDRDIKTDFAEVDARTVLERLAALPITQWRYRDDDPSIRHIGPMAQDFAAAFGVGEDERSIHPVDAQGVAIASIQALHRALGEALEELRAQRAKIEELTGEVQQLRTGSR